ncbi:MAG: hypothetical protein M5R41_09270 [Bacteroidia bacterium]|nr:hypothetical protein [Bacteroidia bacterium]
MLFRTILYGLIFYGIFWLIRRVLGGITGMKQQRATGAGASRGRRYAGKAVDADFEELDDDTRTSSGGKETRNE